MAHNIPKIEYGGIIPTVITFPYPATDGMGREMRNVNRKRTESLSGVQQSVFSSIEVIKKLKFEWLTEEDMDALELFFDNWAAYGKSFRYFEDQLGASYEIYTFDLDKLTPKAKWAQDENRYRYELDLQFRRVLNGVEDTGAMEAEILNNQAVAVDVEGLVLDEEKYLSARVFYEIHRETGSGERLANGEMVFLYYNGAWDIDPGSVTQMPGDHGVVFSVTAGGQVQYTSDNMAGADYLGTVLLRNFTIIGG